jgi:hypothetical protein
VFSFLAKGESRAAGATALLPFGCYRHDVPTAIDGPTPSRLRNTSVCRTVILLVEQSKRRSASLQSGIEVAIDEPLICATNSASLHCFLVFDWIASCLHDGKQRE